MISGPPSGRWLLGCVLVTYLVSNGRWIVPVAAWIAPVFLIRFVRTQRPLWGLGLAFVGLTGVAYVSWWGLVPAPGVLYFVIVTTITAGQLARVAIDRLLCPRLDGVARMLVLPCAIVSCEFASFAISPYGTWGALGYTQFPNLPLLQLVSVTGLCGIAFLIGWFAAVVNDAWEQAFVWSRFRRTACSFAAVSAIVLIVGGARLALFPPMAETVRIASITAPDDLLDGVNLTKLGETLHVSFGARSRTWFGGRWSVTHSRSMRTWPPKVVARPRPGEVVFWPEGQAVAAKESEAELIELGRQTCGVRAFISAWEWLSCTREPGAEIENRFLFLDPEGHTLFDYTKQNPVPGGEARLAVIPSTTTVCRRSARLTDASRLRSASIWISRGFIRQAGEAADIILGPLNDWRAIDPLHTQMACLRGIELGLRGPPSYQQWALAGG